jgi:hypothetical protein
MKKAIRCFVKSIQFVQLLDCFRVYGFVGQRTSIGGRMLTGKAGRPFRPRQQAVVQVLLLLSLAHQTGRSDTFKFVLNFLV